MNHNSKNWNITVIEICYFMEVGRGQSLYGAHNQKNADVTADQPGNITVIQGKGHNILVDTGFGNPFFIEAFNAAHMLTPEEYLREVHLSPADIDTILISHLHYDHVGFLHLFPNAKVIVQQQEYEGWKQAVHLPKRYRLVTCYLDPDTLPELERIKAAGNLILVQDGEEIYEGIHVYLTPGHSYGTQSVVVETEKGSFVICGDSAYTTENIITMTPMGYGFNQLEMLRSFDKIMELADGKVEHIIPGHDLTWPDRYAQTRTIKGKRNRVTDVTD